MTTNQKSLIRHLPVFRLLWLIPFNREGAADNVTELLQRTNKAQSHCLCEQVPQGGRFGRAADDGAAGGVGGQLIEQPILATTANDVDDVDGPAGEFGQLLFRPAIAQSQAFQAAANILAG